MNTSRNEISKTHVGWLLVQGSVFKTWKKRWFALKNETISYFSSPHGKLKGNISLKTYEIERIIYSKKKKHSFKIITPDRTYFLLAKTEEDVNSWINAIISSNPQRKDKIKIDDFEILRVIGRGFLGKVQLVRYIKTNQLFALKSISKAKLEDSNLINQIINEKNALLSINHPFFVTVKYTFQDDTKVFLALEYVPGGELLRQLNNKRQNNDNCEVIPKISIGHVNLSKCNSIAMYDDQNYGGFDLKRTRIYAAQIALAIHHLHSIGFVHRDLKPSNILIDADGYIKMIDFGFIKEQMFGNAAKTSTFCGTPLYAAPEIVLRKPYGRSVDWWSFGVILYQMLFYYPPFYSENLDGLFNSIVKDDLGFPADFTFEGQIKDGLGENEISLVMVDFLQRLLAKDQNKRLGTENEDEIFNHPFFEGISLKNLLLKKTKMDWKPELKNESDVSCFDENYTSERPNFSYINPLIITDETNEAFENFTYQDENDALHDFFI